MMTIAFDVSYIQNRRAGYGRAATELLQSLLKLDHANHYILHGWSYSLDVHQITALQQENVSLSVARIPGALKRLYWNTLRAPSVEFFTGPFDIFHSTDPMLPPTRAGKTITTIYDMTYRKFPELHQQHVRNWHSAITHATERADSVLVPSLQTKSDVLECFPVEERKVHVVHLPVNPVFSQHASVADSAKKFSLTSPYILFAGTLEPRKNIVRLIKAFELIHRGRTVDLHLVLAGRRGWLYHDIFDAMEHSPHRGKIHYLEYVTDAELASLYRAAEFFVYPSLYEGYGFPVLEAMSSGTAVITSNSSSLKEIAGAAALMVEPTNIDELAHAIQTLHENESQRHELSVKGIEHIKQFSSQAAAEKVLALYQSLMKR